MWVPVAGEKISYQGKNGLVEWTRMDMSSHQRQAYLAASQPEKFAGPVGEWTIQIEACQFPPEMPAKERDQVTDGKLSIAADGNATMTFLGDAARMRAVQGDNNELKLVPEKRPPFVCTGSNDWKTIRLTFPPPGDRVTLVFVKAAK